MELLFTLGSLVAPKDLLLSIDSFVECEVRQLPAEVAKAQRHVLAVQDVIKKPSDARNDML